MARRGRGFFSGGVWDGEAIDLVGLEKRVSALEAGGTTDDGPEPGYPAVTYVTHRLEGRNQVYYLLAATFPSNTRRITASIRKHKRDDTYGPIRTFTLRRIPEGATAMDWEVGPFKAGRPRHVVELVAKLATDSQDDGGTRARNPVDESAVADSPLDGTQLATLPAIHGTARQPGTNYILNSRFRYSRFNWSQGAVGTTSELAKWRRAAAGTVGGDSGSYITTTVSSAVNYWVKSGTYRGSLAMVVGASTPTQIDPCARLRGRPFGPGDPFRVEMIALRVGVESQSVDIIATLEDSILGEVARTTYREILKSLPDPLGNPDESANTSWNHFRFPEATVSATYAPSQTSKQWVRFRISHNLSAVTLYIDKVKAGKVYGGFRYAEAEAAHDDDIDSTEGYEPDVEPTSRAAKTGDVPPGEGIIGDEADIGTRGIRLSAPSDANEND